MLLGEMDVNKIEAFDPLDRATPVTLDRAADAIRTAYAALRYADCPPESFHRLAFVCRKLELAAEGLGIKL